MSTVNSDKVLSTSLYSALSLTSLEVIGISAGSSEGIVMPGRDRARLIPAESTGGSRARVYAVAIVLRLLFTPVLHLFTDAPAPGMYKRPLIMAMSGGGGGGADELE